MPQWRTQKGKERSTKLKHKNNSLWNLNQRIYECNEENYIENTQKRINPKRTNQDMPSQLAQHYIIYYNGK